MTATDRAAALELARETIAAIESIPTGFVVRVEERLIKVCRALLAAEAERERLSGSTLSEDDMHMCIGVLGSFISDYETGRPSADKYVDKVSACRRRLIAALPNHAPVTKATTDTERHDG